MAKDCNGTGDLAWAAGQEKGEADQKEAGGAGKHSRMNSQGSSVGLLVNLSLGQEVDFRDMAREVTLVVVYPAEWINSKAAPTDCGMSLEAQRIMFDGLRDY